MVILGGLEVVAAGYLINRHNKNKKEEARIREEEERLEEHRYRIHSPNTAGPSSRRGRSRSRDRKHSSHRRRRSYDGSYPSDHKHPYENQRPSRDSRMGGSVPPPPAAPVAAAPPAYFPPTGWPSHWEQSQQPPSNAPMEGPPRGSAQGFQQQANLSPYYKDPAQPDVKYGYHDQESQRGRSHLLPADASRSVGGRHSRLRARSDGGVSSHVRFVGDNRQHPGDEPPPYRS